MNTIPEVRKFVGEFSDPHIIYFGVRLVAFMIENLALAF